MDNLATLMRELSSKYADDVPLEVLEAYCRRYLHYYHRHVENQPVRFYGSWGWTEARRREFRKAFDASRRQLASGSGMQLSAMKSGGRQDGT